MRKEAMEPNNTKETRTPKKALKAKQSIPIYQIDPMAAYRDQFICGDSLEVMRQMPSASIDLVVTSPPYNLKNSTGNGMKDGRGGKWANAQLVNGYSHHDDCMPHDKYAAWQHNCLAEMFRLIKDDGAIFYNHKWRVQDGLLQDRQDIVASFPVRQIIIWRRKCGINFNKGYFLPTYKVQNDLLRRK